MERKMTKTTRTLLLLLLIIPAVSAIDINSCQTINQPGTYTLTQDITAEGNCFSIQANNVVLDLNSHSILQNQVNSMYGTTVIITDSNNIEIKNGIIANFLHAIHASNSTNIQISDIQTNCLESIYFSSSSNNIIKDSVFIGADSSNPYTGDVNLFSNSINNVFLDDEYNVEYVQPNSELLRKWYLDITTVDQKNNIIQNANVKSYVYKSSSPYTGIEEFSLFTDVFGKIKGEVLDYTNNGYIDPTYHIVKVEKQDYTASPTKLFVNNNVAQTIVMNRIINADLNIISLKPIQVIEDVDSNANGKIDLIENKPVMARVKINFASQETVLDNIKVKLEVIDSTGKTVFSEEKTINLKKEYSLGEIKQGLDTINFFITDTANKWMPQKNINYKFTATITLPDTIKDTNLENNIKSTMTETGHNKKMIVVDPQTLTSDNKDRADSILNDNYAFFKTIFPITSTSDMLKYKAIRNPILFSVNKLKQIAQLRKTDIYNIFNEFVNTNENNLYPIFPSVLTANAFDGKIFPVLYDVTGVAKDKWNTETQKSYPVILIPNQKTDFIEKSLAMLIGGESNIKVIDNWKKYNSRGDLASNGWCLDQDTGKDCGARINIFNSFDNKPRLDEGKMINEGKNKLFWLTEFDYNSNTELGLRYYDLGAYAPTNNTWISISGYNKLIKEYIIFK